ncbi:MAG: hypothetical protein JSS66_06655 [Armatimonadetes bacterium]|nr:hypothetical protein [Armatimonadota bacterium]
MRQWRVSDPVGFTQALNELGVLSLESHQGQDDTFLIWVYDTQFDKLVSLVAKFGRKT